MHGTRSGIYEIRNVLNNKVYIGSSVDIPERWNEHKRELSKKQPSFYTLAKSME